MSNNGKSVKDMLIGGESPESLMEQLKKEIAAAQSEINKENASKSERLDTMRTEAIAAVLDYLEELDVIDLSDDSDDVIEELLSTAEETVKGLEPEIKRYARLIKLFLDVEEGKYDCDNKKVDVKFDTNVVDIDNLDKKLNDLINKLIN